MKNIKGYEGLYAITSCGRVWSYKSKKFLKHRLDKDGYPRVTISKCGELKTFHIHTLVAQAYLPNPEGLNEINHKDEIKDHNWYMNLEYCTHKYNLNYGTRNERAGLSRSKTSAPGAKKMVYCLELDMLFNSLTEAAEKCHVDQGAISKCIHCQRDSAGKHPVTGEKLHWQLVLHDIA